MEIRYGRVVYENQTKLARGLCLVSGAKSLGTSIAIECRKINFHRRRKASAFFVDVPGTDDDDTDRNADTIKRGP